MAINVATIWEVQTSGLDGSGGYGGGFFTGSSQYGTNLLVTNSGGMTSSPIVSSTTHTFTSMDVGHWLYIGINNPWIPGWYQITGVITGSGMINAGIGQATIFQTNTFSGACPDRLNPSLGCATTASPTGGTFAIDFSQNTPVLFTGLVCTSTSGINFTCSNLQGISPGTRWLSGNTINILGGSGFTPGRYQITSGSANTSEMQVDRSFGAASGAIASGYLGGPLATPGYAASQRVIGNCVFIKNGTYTITTRTANVSSGCILEIGANTSGNTSRWTGYSGIRQDSINAVTLIFASGVTSGTLLRTSGNYCLVDNLTFDGNKQTASRGYWAGTTRQTIQDCNAYNCNSGAFVCSNNGAIAINCLATGCSVWPAYAQDTGPTAANFSLYNCRASNNSAGGLGVVLHAYYCIADNNTGDGIGFTNATMAYKCVAYNNTNGGFNIGGAGGAILMDCVAENNASGFLATSATIGNFLYNCAAYNNTVNYANVPEQVNCIVGTGTFFAGASTGNFAPSLTSQALYGGYGVFPRGLTTQYTDIGFQHQELSINDIASGIWNYSSRTLTG